MSVFYELGVGKGEWESNLQSSHFCLILAKIDPKNEEEEKRRIEARREKQRRRREKNSEKYGDGYRFVLKSQKIGLIKKTFSRKVKSMGT